MANLDIARQLKNLRKSSGLSQSFIASYLSVDQSYLSKIESGERVVTVDILEKLSELYNCDISDFENTDISIAPLNISFRSNELDSNDIKVISVINHIANNSKYMAKLLEESESKWLINLN